MLPLSVIHSGVPLNGLTHIFLKRRLLNRLIFLVSNVKRSVWLLSVKIWLRLAGPIVLLI